MGQFEAFGSRFSCRSNLGYQISLTKGPIFSLGKQKEIFYGKDFRHFESWAKGEYQDILDVQAEDP